MKGFLKFFGWLLIISSAYFYFTLWMQAFEYLSLKIGSLLSIILLLATNLAAPEIYIVWHWIAEGFPLEYFITTIISSIAFLIGYKMKSKAKEIEYSESLYIKHGLTSHYYSEPLQNRYPLDNAKSIIEKPIPPPPLFKYTPPGIFVDKKSLEESRELEKLKKQIEHETMFSGTPDEIFKNHLELLDDIMDEFDKDKNVKESTKPNTQTKRKFEW